MSTAAQTILQLQKDRSAAEHGRQEALLALAEMEHELYMLRSMRKEIAACLTDRRILSNANRVNKVARIIRDCPQ